MPVTDTDTYIEKTAEFAKPILRHLRALIHTACPEVEETIKWGFPHFLYHNQILCGIAAFKHHCALTFWKASQIPGLQKTHAGNAGKAMGQFGKITSLKDLPSDTAIKKYIRAAMQLTAAKVKRQSVASTAEVQTAIPEYFMEQLRKNKRAKSVFDKLPPSHKKEYLEWITSAKMQATLERRMQSAIEKLVALSAAK